MYHISLALDSNRELPSLLSAFEQAAATATVPLLNPASPAATASCRLTQNLGKRIWGNFAGDFGGEILGANNILS